MMNAFFEPIANGEDEEPAGPPDSCTCGSDLITVEIDCGSVYIICAACKKGKPYGFEDNFCTDSLTFRYSVASSGCTCNFMEQYTCDCGHQYLLGVLVTEGESMNTHTEGATGG